MSDIKLFRLTSGAAIELQGDVADLEKPLQSLIERNLEPLLGIRFLASEYSTGKTHAGRIDSLGLDENSCPVILEYKRSVGENVINQGLFYLDWLMDHQAEFELLVMRTLGVEASAAIDWTAPRVVCIASDFTKYDAHAVQQIKRNIELIRYRLFGEELLLLEQASVGSAAVSKSMISKAILAPRDNAVEPIKNRSADRSYAEWLIDLPPMLRVLLASLEDYINSLGDDVERKELKLYVAFKRLKNFTTVVLQKNRLLVYVHVNPDQIALMPNNARDVLRHQRHVAGQGGTSRRLRALRLRARCQQSQAEEGHALLDRVRHVQSLACLLAATERTFNGSRLTFNTSEKVMHSA